MSSGMSPTSTGRRRRASRLLAFPHLASALDARAGADADADLALIRQGNPPAHLGGGRRPAVEEDPQPLLDHTRCPRCRSSCRRRPRRATTTAARRTCRSCRRPGLRAGQRPRRRPLRRRRRPGARRRRPLARRPGPSRGGKKKASAYTRTTRTRRRRHAAGAVEVEGEVEGRRRRRRQPSSQNNRGGGGGWGSTWASSARGRRSPDSMPFLAAAGRGRRAAVRRRRRRPRAVVAALGALRRRRRHAQAASRRRGTSGFGPPLGSRQYGAVGQYGGCGGIERGSEACSNFWQRPRLGLRACARSRCTRVELRTRLCARLDMTSTSARPLVGYAITYAIGDLVYGTPRLSGNTRPYAADNELGVVTDVQDPKRHMVLWLSGDFNDVDDNSSFVVEDQPVERPCRRADLSRKAKTVQLPAPWSNDEPQAPTQAAARRLVVAGEETPRAATSRAPRPCGRERRGAGAGPSASAAPRNSSRSGRCCASSASAKQQRRRSGGRCRTRRRRRRRSAPPAERRSGRSKRSRTAAAVASPASAVVDLEGAGGGGDGDDEVQFVSQSVARARGEAAAEVGAVEGAGGGEGYGC